MNTLKLSILGLVLTLILSTCKKPDNNNTDGPYLVFKFKFDSTQARLDNFGQPASMPAGHAGQNPSMNVMSAHYIELAPSALTALGAGDILYETPSSTAGGTSAIDFAQEPLTEDGGIVYKTPIKNVTPGSYQYLRVSLAYQNYDVKMLIDTTIAGITINQEFPCTIASFVGFNTYIPDFKIKTSIISVNGNRLQGFWGFESPINYFGFNYDVVDTGQAPANATTVVNPISATSPIPAGSCVATGAFNNNTAQPLHITGTETSDVVVTISLSTNHSFEWVEVNPDGKWEPLKGEYIVDMGIRGLMPTVQY